MHVDLEINGIMCEEDLDGEKEHVEREKRWETMHVIPIYPKQCKLVREECMKSWNYSNLSVVLSFSKCDNKCIFILKILQ